MWDPMQWIVREPKVAKAFCRFLTAIIGMNDPEDIASFGVKLFAPLRYALVLPLRVSFLLMKWWPRFGVAIFIFGVNMSVRRFVASGNQRSIARVMRRARRGGYKVNFDILGETAQSEKEAIHFLVAYYTLIDTAERYGCAEGLNISFKLSSFCSQIDPACPKHAVEILVARLTPLVARIHAHHGRVFLDAEEYTLRRVYVMVFTALYERFGSTLCPVVQAYLRDSSAFLDEFIAMNRENDQIDDRLVRGAYWEEECARADENDWPRPPVFTNKWETDRNFMNLFWKGRRHGLGMIPATQNIESIMEIAFSCAITGKSVPEFQVLNGLAGPIVKILVAKGYPVRVYQPMSTSSGDLMETAAYLFRRVVELISETSFLAQHRGPDFKEALKKLKTITEYRR